jgi:predicted amidohydrolase
MKVALIQADSPPGESMTDRILRIGDLVSDHGDADLVVLPELWSVGYFSFSRYRESAQAADGPLMQQVCAWARGIGTHVHAGSMIERDPAGKLYNTAALVGPDGSVLLRYRKIHVFGYDSLEAQLLTGGEAADVVATDLGQLGTTTCYDLRFPELYRLLGDHGAEIVVVPAAWPQARLAHWQLLTRARAVENQVFVLACNAAGEQEGVQLAGHSAVIDPWGRVVAEAGADPEVLRAEIDLQGVAEVRDEFPVLKDRRLLCTPSLRPVI